MRCQSVIHELSAPSEQPRPAALTEHLAACPSCARWAERNARLDQVWEATRAPELSTAAWDQIWANVSDSLDRAPAMPRLVPTPAPVPVLVPNPAASRPWARPALAFFALAQAAAILLCFSLAWRQGPDHMQQRPRQAPATAVASKTAAGDAKAGDLPAFEILQDQIAMISLDQGSIRNLTPVESPNGVDPLFSGFNAIESQAELQ